VLQRDASDIHAQWLSLHALFAAYVSGSVGAASTETRARIIDLASRYEAANGPHAALAHEWAAVVR
jgi:hypothetical protein